MNECGQCGERGSVWNKYSLSNRESSAPDPIIWVCVGCGRHVCVNCILTIPNSSPIEIRCPSLCSEECMQTWKLKAKLTGDSSYDDDDVKLISVAKDFSKFPAGRYRSDGPCSGEEFREVWLAPALTEGRVRVQLNGTMGYGSSFLEEAFGGLVRVTGLSVEDLERNLELEAFDPSLVAEAWSYIRGPV